MLGPEQTFWLDGVERVVIHQLLRAPGLYWESSQTDGRIRHLLQLLGERGAHLKIEAVGEKTTVRLGAHITVSTRQWREWLDCEDSGVEKQLASMYLGTYGRQRVNSRLAPFATRSLPLTQGLWMRWPDLELLWRAWSAWVRDTPPPDETDGLAHKILYPVGRQIGREVHRYLEIFARKWRSLCMPVKPVIQLDIGRVVAVFLKTSPTSQAVDQTNPLAALAHRRRVTLLGKGGLKKERVPDQARNVHPSHFGRLCPIDAGEGQSVGLRYHPARYVAVDEEGRLGTAVIDQQTGERAIIWSDEEHLTCIQPGVELSAGQLRAGTGARWAWPTPTAGFSASLVCTPFLEHTDAARAVMSAGHMGQAVAPWRVQVPLVLSGGEEPVARESGFNLYSPVDGKVERVCARQIQVSGQRLELIKFRPGNMRTSAKVQIHQRPVVEVGQYVEAGELLADGYASCGGILSLGANLWVGYLSYEGYNFEDGIVISERVVREGLLSAVMMKTHEVDLRRTELGDERFAASLLVDAPADATNAHLNPRTGLPFIGSKISNGRIIAGRLSPRKTRSELSGEEVLAEMLGYFGGRYRERHAVAGMGEEGTVIDVRIVTEDLPPDIIARAIITVAHRTQLEVGDKLSGRNGNKGIITLIAPEEDMPLLPDGTPLDILLNPLGVPSRMNLGQVYETQLGLCARVLGRSYTVSQFDEVYDDRSEDLLYRELEKARQVAPWILPGGRVWLRDGRTGETYDRPVCVGSQYILAAEHMVAKKEHARSEGAYDLVTGQPVAGRKAGGGQRIGEMEAWALMAHGAAFTLHEMMTVKSDDPESRLKCHHDLCMGKLPVLNRTGIPLAFEALIGELRSNALDLRFGKIK